MDLSNLIHQSSSSAASSSTFATPTSSSTATHHQHNHQHQNSKSNDQSSLTLAYVRKLDGLYKNLEERVRHLESALCTGSVTVLPSDSKDSEGNVLSTSTSTTAAGPKKICKTDLEDYCLPLLQKRASPTLAELSTLAMTLKTSKYHHLESRLILSKIREWFRRKREYMTQRVVNVCQRRFPPASLDSAAVGSLLLVIAKGSTESLALLKEVAKEANLEVIEQESLLEFTKEKCISYLENLQSSYKQV